jgi:hypothetical protein
LSSHGSIVRTINKQSSLFVYDDGILLSFQGACGRLSQVRWFWLMAALAWLLGCSDDAETSSTQAGGAGGAGGIGGAGGVGTGAAGGAGGSGGDCVSSLPADEELPALLSETGLYDDIATKAVAARVERFVPRHALWSDAADKERWVYLPECGTIDTSDMNDWSLPVGTRLWKEFSVGGARIETRLIERIGDGPHEFAFTSYLWNAEETEATRVPDGVVDAKGTDHDVPDEGTCRACHGSHATGGGRPSRALGFSALQLSEASELSLEALAASGRLSDPPAGPLPIPGDNPTEREALGYLHANCGHCHNATSDRVQTVDLNLWLDVEATAVMDTGAYQTGVGVPNTLFADQHVTARIEPGDPGSSAVWFRMNERGNNAQMPPVGSETVDATGLAAVQSWIEALP